MPPRCASGPAVDWDSPEAREAIDQACAIVAARLHEDDFEAHLGRILGTVFAGVVFRTGHDCAEAVMRTARLVSAMGRLSCGALHTAAAASSQTPTAVLDELALSARQAGQRAKVGA